MCFSIANWRANWYKVSLHFIAIFSLMEVSSVATAVELCLELRLAGALTTFLCSWTDMSPLSNALDRTPGEILVDTTWTELQLRLPD